MKSIGLRFFEGIVFGVELRRVNFVGVDLWPVIIFRVDFYLVFFSVLDFLRRHLSRGWHSLSIPFIGVDVCWVEVFDVDF